MNIEYALLPFIWSHVGCWFFVFFYLRLDFVFSYQIKRWPISFPYVIVYFFVTVLAKIIRGGTAESKIYERCALTSVKRIIFRYSHSYLLV